MAAFYVFPECEAGNHTQCPEVDPLPEDLLEQGMCGGGACSCSCHFKDLNN